MVVCSVRYPNRIQSVIRSVSPVTGIRNKVSLRGENGNDKG